MRKSKKIKHKLLDIYLVTLADTFSKESKIRLLLVLLENYNKDISIPITKITQTIGQTYTHVFKMLYELQDDGFVTLTRQGRSNVITLTSMGLELAGLMQEMILDTAVVREIRR